MRRRHNLVRYCLFALTLWLLAAGATRGADWPGTKSDWHGYERHDFVVDGQPCHVVLPSQAAPGQPWCWRARFPEYHAEPDLLLLKRGFHVAYINTDGMFGSPRAMGHWEAFCEVMTGQHGLAAKPAVEAVSRGGLFAYAWASRHPNKVACIYADTPVCDFKSWPLGQGEGLGAPGSWETLLKEYGFTQEEALAYDGNPIDTLQPLAEAAIPILHVVSLNDRVVPPEENSFLLAERYRKLGGPIDLIEVAEGTAESNGHHFPHPDPLRVADFIERHATVLPLGNDYFVLRGSLDNCRIDDGPWRTRDLFTAWSQSLHLPWAYVLEDELDGKAHTLTVRISDNQNEKSCGHACRVVHLLVNE